MAQYRGFSYDELVKPLESVQKAHNEVITDMASLSQNSEILDYYLDPERDKQSYEMYNRFKNELNFNVDDFARNGLTRNNGMKLLSLHRNYNNNVANVLDAIKSREADRAEQQKLQEASKGQTIFGHNGNDGNANLRSVDFYLQGNKGFVYQNLDDIKTDAKNFAAAASKRKYTNNFDKNVNENNKEANIKALAGQYWQMMERTGYDNRQAYKIINYLMDEYEHIIDGKDVPDYEGSHPDGFIKNMRRMLQERNIDQFSDEDKGRMINAYINGIDEGLTYEPKYTWKETEQMKRAGRNVQTVNVDNGKFQNPDKSRSAQDENLAVSKFTNENRKEQENMTQSLTGNSEAGTSPLTVAVNRNGVTLHRLANLAEYLNACGYKYKDGNYVYSNGTLGRNGIVVQSMIINGQEKKVNVPRGMYNDYVSKIKDITDTYHFNKGDGSTIFTPDINTMINPQTTNEYLEYYLTNQMRLNDRDSKPHIFISTQMRINQNNKEASIGNAFARLGDRGLYYNAIYDPKTRTWEFGGRDNGKYKTAILNSDINKGCDIGLVYMPQSKHDNEPLWVMIRTNAMIDGKNVPPTFIPLKDFTSMTDSKIANTMNELAKNRREIINRNAEILGIDNNVSISKIKSLISEYKNIKDDQERDVKLDCAYQILESIEYIDYFLHKRNSIADNGNQANRTIKQVIDDLDEIDSK